MASKISLIVLSVLSVARAEVSGISMVTRTLDQCNKDSDIFSCLKGKAVNLLDRAMVVDTLPVNEFLTISRDSSASASQVAPLTTLPKDPQVLDELLVDRVGRYLTTRIINFKMPKVEVEGRKKKKGGLGLFVLGGAWGLMLLKLTIGAIAIIAGKALIIAKVALLIAGILGLKGLMHHGEKHSAQVIYAEPEAHHSGGGGVGSWGRNGVVPESAHDLAYKGQRALSS